MIIIKAKFNSMDEAENAIVALKENFTFSYSFIETNLKNTDFNDYINSTIYNSLTSPIFSSALNFCAYPSPSNLENHTSFERDKVIVNIKCALSEADYIIGKLWNLGAESVKEAEN